MSTLYYIGADPLTGEDIISRLSVEDILNSGVSRGYAAGQAATLAVPKATKDYVDTQDGLYAEKTYYTAQDAFLVPVASRGQANGVASLQGSPPKIPDAQIPILGVGYLRGPLGINQNSGGTYNATGFDTNPVKVGTWNVGVPGIPFQPLLYCSCLVQAHVDGRPVLEARIGDLTQTTYGAQTPIGQAIGRTHYGDYQSLTILPSSASLGADGTVVFAGATNWHIDLWLRDESGFKIFLPGGNITSASLWLMRVAL
jgi:hypothetical protein